MNILIVNDDSIDSPGIALLAQAAGEFGRVWVVAPDAQCSAMSQKVTIRGSLTAKPVENFPANVEGAYRVTGSPADCVRVALDCLLEERPDYVFSGINDGYNVGYDIAYSGTVGAAMEAVMNGVPAIAFSNAFQASLDTPRAYIRSVLAELLQAGLGCGEIWNVNFPDRGPQDVAGILHNRCIGPARIFDNAYQRRDLPDGSCCLDIQVDVMEVDETLCEASDVAAVHRGYVSIGKVLCPVMEHHAGRRSL